MIEFLTFYGISAVVLIVVFLAAGLWFKAFGNENAAALCGVGVLAGAFWPLVLVVVVVYGLWWTFNQGLKGLWYGSGKETGNAEVQDSR